MIAISFVLTRERCCPRVSFCGFSVTIPRAALKKPSKSFVPYAPNHATLQSKESKTCSTNGGSYYKGRSYNSSGKEAFSDPYDRFRCDEPFPDALLSEIRHEKYLVGEFIDSRSNLLHATALHSQQRTNFQQQIFSEITSAARALARCSGLEIGPTGTHEYFFHDCSITGMRNFWRQTVSCNRSSTDNGKERHGKELVLRINPQQLLGPMSLSHDEKYLAYLSLPDYSQSGDKRFDVDAVAGCEGVIRSSSRSVLIVRDISSGDDLTLPVLSAENVEFGGVYDESQGRSLSPEGDTTNAKEVSRKDMNAEGDDNSLVSLYTLFYTTANSLHRPDSVWRCDFDGRSASEPKLVLRDDNEANFVDITRTKGTKYVAINSTSKTSNEVHLAHAGGEKPVLVRRRNEGVQYFVDCAENGRITLVAHRNKFFESISDQDINEEISVFETYVPLLPLEHSFGKKIHCGEEAAAMGNPAYIEEIDLFDRHLVLYERGLDGQQIRVRSKDCTFDGLDERNIIKLPPGLCSCSTISAGGNSHLHSSKLRFTASNVLTPSITFECDLESLELNEVSRKSFSLLDPVDFEQNRISVQSKDGTAVPLTIVHRKDKWMMNGGRPTLLMGYGAYGEPQDLHFDPMLVPLLRRGWAIAFAHTRGGGDLGKSWYEKGRLMNKEKSVEDFLSCAEALLYELNVTNPDRLAVKGASAGGVLVACAVNRSPELFKAVVLESPFLDVSRAMSDDTLPLTVHEWEEWGNPLVNADHQKCIERYCPFSNIRRQHYPKMLLVAALDDYSVPFWHSATFVSKVRDCMIDNIESKSFGGGFDIDPDETKGILLHIEESGGHHFQRNRLDVASLVVMFLNCAVLDGNTVGKSIDNFSFTNTLEKRFLSSWTKD